MLRRPPKRKNKNTYQFLNKTTDELSKSEEKFFTNIKDVPESTLAKSCQTDGDKILTPIENFEKDLSSESAKLNVDLSCSHFELDLSNDHDTCNLVPATPTSIIGVEKCRLDGNL